MAELIATATEAEWLEARRQGVTASEIAVVMGLSPYSSPYALWHQKLGILPSDDQTDAMEFGAFCEPYVVAKFAAAHPQYAIDGDGRELYAHPERPWQMATPDRMLWDGGDQGTYENFRGQVMPWQRANGDPVAAVLETKIDNGSDEWGDEGTDEIPGHYTCQVIWQMDVMGVSRAHVACLGRDRKVRFYVVEMDDAARHLLDQMLAAARDFLDLIDYKEPPEVDYHPATGAALRALYQEEGGGDIRVRASLAISYAAAVKRYDAAKRRKDEMTNAVLEVLRNKRRAIDPRTGDPIATRSVSRPRRVDLDQLRALYPDVAAVCTPEPKAEVRLLPAKTKKEKHVSPDSE